MGFGDDREVESSIELSCISFRLKGLDVIMFNYLAYRNFFVSELFLKAHLSGCKWKDCREWEHEMCCDHYVG